MKETYLVTAWFTKGDGTREFTKKMKVTIDENDPITDVRDEAFERLPENANVLDMEEVLID